MDLTEPAYLCAQSAAGKIPSSYELCSQKKGAKRYKSPRLAQLLQDHAAADEARELALSGILQARAQYIPGPSWLNLPDGTGKACHTRYMPMRVCS